MKPNELKVGDPVFAVLTASSRTTATTVVSKVGRDWVYVSQGRYRFPRNADWPAQLDGGNYSSPGNVYPDETAYRDEQARSRAYMQIKHNMGYTPPKGSSLADIQQAAKLLGVNLK